MFATCLSHLTIYHKHLSLSAYPLMHGYIFYRVMTRREMPISGCKIYEKKGLGKSVSYVGKAVLRAREFLLSAHFQLIHFSSWHQTMLTVLEKHTPA